VQPKRGSERTFQTIPIEERGCVSMYEMEPGGQRAWVDLGRSLSGRGSVERETETGSAIEGRQVRESLVLSERGPDEVRRAAAQGRKLSPVTNEMVLASNAESAGSAAELGCELW
jgi:hypothetical protein